MHAKILSPFLEAIFEVLPEIGCSDVKQGKLNLKERLIASLEVTAIVGLSDDLQGNVAYCMSGDTAKNMASIMMMGMPVGDLDEMAQSAIAEMANMITARASTAFSGLGSVVRISPPVLITGENVTVMVSQVRTFCIEIITGAGIIEVNVGLEM